MEPWGGCHRLLVEPPLPFTDVKSNVWLGLSPSTPATPVHFRLKHRNPPQNHISRVALSWLEVSPDSPIITFLNHFQIANSLVPFTL